MNTVPTQPGTPRTGRIRFWLAAVAALAIPFAVNGEPQEGGTNAAGESLEPLLKDMRTFVEMPDNARKILQGDMLDHLAVLNEINRHLSENNLDAAAEVAETGMGRNLLSKYQDVGMRPGRYMPKEMREIGWELHRAATEFAELARKGELRGALHAYQRITSACVACHYSYRTY
ncbi:MAG: hypothetical protein PVF08_08580 [Gammaproteobacteria bacterium]|jgi:hypothetical protein